MHSTVTVEAAVSILVALCEHRSPLRLSTFVEQTHQRWLQAPIVGAAITTLALVILPLLAVSRIRAVTLIPVWQFYSLTEPSSCASLRR